MGKIKLDKIIPIGLYISTLFGIVLFALSSPIVSDRVLEFKAFMEVINSGGQANFNGGLVNSSLLGTWLPARIHLFTGLDSILLFKIFPSIFFSATPSFVYLLSRKYLDRLDSLIASCVILASFYFAYNPLLGRVNIGWGILAILIWAILGKHWKSVVASSILLPLAHYGTFFLTLSVVGVVTVYFVFKKLLNTKVDSKDVKVVLIVLMILVVGMFSWYGFVSPSTGNVVKYFTIVRSFRVLTAILQDPLFTIIEEEGRVEIEEGRVEIKEEGRVEIKEEGRVEIEEGRVEIKEEGEVERSPLRDFLRLESRGGVVQSAFGLTLHSMNTPQKIEWVTSWLVVILMSIGLLSVFRGKLFSSLYQWLALTFYGAIILTLVFPHMSLGYGVVRVYFTGLLILAPCVPVGGNKISEFIKVPKHLLASLVVLVYGLAVSGVLHSWFGIVK